MKKIRFVIPAPFTVALGVAALSAALVSCWSFSSNPDQAAMDSETSSGNLRDDGASPGSSSPEAAAPDSSGITGNSPGGAASPGGDSEGATANLPLDSTGSPSSMDTPAGSAENVPDDPGGAAGSGAMETPGMTGEAPPAAPVTPCELLSAGGHPCVAAHSTTRVVFGGYDGPLYQVCRGTAVAGPNSCRGMTRDIGSLENGYADSAAQDEFCNGGACTITIIYDQSPNANDLHPSPAGGFKPTPDNPAVATDLKTTVNGNPVYGIFIKPGMGYRAGCGGCATRAPVGTAVGDEPETMYMVTSVNGLVNGCCFDYGNAETSSRDDGNGTMEAVYFGGGVVWGTGSPGGHNNGPWVMADLENGLYAGWENNQDQNISTNTPIRFPFITGVVIGDTADKNGGRGRFAIYGGNASAGNLQVLYDGIRPAKPGYVPMQKQGSIILGIGGDNSSSGGGQWFEGVMASGAATLAEANALQANIVAAGYGK